MSDQPIPSGSKPGDQPGPDQTGEVTCPDCDGTGRLAEEPCPNCAGTGYVRQIVGDA